MIDVGAALELAAAASARQPIGTTLADASTLYRVFEAVKAKTFNPTAMAAAGTLEPTVAALARTATLLDQLLADKVQGPRVVALVQSLTS